MSKVNYEDMSDFEISLKVAELLDLKPSVMVGKVCINFRSTDNGDYTYSTFNPCSNPSDAWAIIIENEISLDPRRTIKKMPWMACYSDQIYATDKNPLRAAMICFLKMKDAEK